MHIQNKVHSSLRVHLELMHHYSDEVMAIVSTVTSVRRMCQTSYSDSV